MFTKSASFYELLYSFKNYDAAASKVTDLIDAHAPTAKSVLDVGCGTGAHLRRLAGRFDVQGLDIDAGLLAVARDKAPAIRFHQADMADFDLATKFDVITCLFSAIAYVETLNRTRAAIACMAHHLAPGGLLIIEPWFDEESYWTGTVTLNQVTAEDMKIAWMYTSHKQDRISVLDIHYLVGTAERVEYLTEQHRMGLFSREEHAQAIADAGLTYLGYDAAGLFNRGLHLARR